MNMLTFSKTVLDKVSFDESLFEKELRKSINRLMVDEVEELRCWAYKQFPQLYPVLQRCFQEGPSTSSSLIRRNNRLRASASN